MKKQSRSESNRCILNFVIFFLISVSSCSDDRNNEYTISGPLKKYHSIAVYFKGPDSRSGNVSPNPFLDYRLWVVFTSPSGKTCNVPGFYNGNGKGENSGNIWTVRFTPLEQGEYSFKASFQKGTELAVQPLTKEGESVDFDGASGNFQIKDAGNDASGFHQNGMLLCSEGHYLQFTDGTYWLKGGTDSPEDFLGYKGFCNTPNATHDFQTHIQDWKPGDPDWNNGAGKGVIGALNYLAENKVNSIYFLTMNIGGDGENVWPFLMSDSLNHMDSVSYKLHYDIKKLEQWEKVFAHAQNKGIYLHFVLNEGEEANKKELDNGELGTERKLYYREIIARFSHYLGLQWNLCEEYDHKDFAWPPETIKSFAGYIRSVDPYGHPVTVHNFGRVVGDAWDPFIGDNLFCLASLQTYGMHEVEKFRNQSREAGNPLVLGMDEFFPDKVSNENVERQRKEYIWPIYFSGGQMEFILNEALHTNDFRKYETLWVYMWYARQFLLAHLPFQDMSPADSLLSGESVFEGKHNTIEGQVFLKEDDVYAVYFPVARRTGILKAASSGQYLQRWYNPRSGEFAGGSQMVRFLEKQAVSIGSPPSDPSQDWVTLFTKNKR